MASLRAVAREGGAPWWTIVGADAEERGGPDRVCVPMARYHFHISNGHPFSDSEGQDFPDDHAAWNEALRTVHDVEATLNLDTSRHWSLEVTRDGTAIFRIDVSAQRLGQIAS